MKNIQFSAVGRSLTALARQPQWVAVFLSVGFHGVLFAAGPSFSSLNMTALGGDVPEQERREVPLIELTPEEQSRLPDFSSSAFSPFPDDSQTFSLVPPANSNPAFPSPSQESRPQSSPAPSPLGSRNPWLPGVSAYTSPRSSTNPSAIVRLPSSNASPMRTPGMSPSPGATPQGRPNGSDSEATPSTPTPEGPAEDGVSTDASDLLPRVAVNRQGADEPADSLPLDETAAASPTDTPQPAVPEQIAAFVYSEEGTTDAETEAAIETWTAAAQEQFQEELSTAEEPLEITVPYQGGVCLSPEPSDGLLGLVAVPKTAESGETTLSLSTTVLKSTGYSFLNEAAANSLGGLEAGTIQPGVLYQAVVNVDYDDENCTPAADFLKSVTSDQEATAPAQNPTRNRTAPPAANPAPESGSPADNEAAPADEATETKPGAAAEQETPTRESEPAPNSDASQPLNQ